MMEFDPMTVLGNTARRGRLDAIALLLWAVLSVAPALACGGIYVVKEGDSLSFIADRLYKDASQWTMLHRANRTIVGDDPDSLRAGIRLDLPCVNGRPDGLDGTTTLPAAAATAPVPVAALPGSAPINLVTAGDFAPFAGRTLSEGGLITDVMGAVMTQAGLGETMQINWINDRSAHLDPLLREGMMDVAFPVYRPDCAAMPDLDLCREVLFSDPLFEVLIVLFTDRARPLPFVQDADMAGKTLCRPEGYATDDLDANGRNWLSGGMITLMQPPSVRDCFTMLAGAQVDAVAINEFTGRAMVRAMQLDTQVEAMTARPLAIRTLHAVVHKDRADARSLLGALNTALAQIRENGAFQRVLDRHLPQFWAQF